MSGEMYRAGRPAPGARLLAAAALVRRGSVVADVGTDHGKLAVYLVLSGIAPRVIATDVNPLPLAKARALVAQTGSAGKVECRLGDGLKALQPGEVQDIVMAGLSGETMANLLAEAPWVRREDVRLVLLPAARGPELRRWLRQNGWDIEQETPVKEHGRYYSAMRAAYTGRGQPRPDPLFCQVGLVPKTQNEAAEGYIRARLRQLEHRRKAPLNDTERAELEALISEVQACLP